MALVLPEELVAELEALAKSEAMSPAELLAKLLELAKAPPIPGTLAALAESALMNPIPSKHPVDTSERSREILETEFAKHLNDYERLTD
jgi:hypothetical protein